MAMLTQAQHDFMERFVERDRVPVMIFNKRTRNMVDRLIDKGFITQIEISHTGQHAVIEITANGKRALAE